MNSSMSSGSRRGSDAGVLGDSMGKTDGLGRTDATVSSMGGDVTSHHRMSILEGLVGDACKFVPVLVTPVTVNATAAEWTFDVHTSLFGTDWGEPILIQVFDDDGRSLRCARNGERYCVDDAQLFGRGLTTLSKLVHGPEPVDIGLVHPFLPSAVVPPGWVSWSCRQLLSSELAAREPHTVAFQLSLKALAAHYASSRMLVSLSLQEGGALKELKSIPVTVSPMHGHGHGHGSAVSLSLSSAMLSVSDRWDSSLIFRVYEMPSTEGRASGDAQIVLSDDLLVGCASTSLLCIYFPICRNG